MTEKHQRSAATIAIEIGSGHPVTEQVTNIKVTSDDITRLLLRTSSEAELPNFDLEKTVTQLTELQTALQQEQFPNGPGEIDPELNTALRELSSFLNGIKLMQKLASRPE